MGDTLQLPPGATLVDSASSGSSNLPPGASLVSGSVPDPNADKGVMASLKRSAGGFIHLPGVLWDAVNKPPQNEEEQKAFDLADKVGQGKQALAMMRLVAAPMVQEHLKAQQLRQQAATQPDDQANNAYNGTNHMANMHDIASAVPVLGPMSADIVDRYLHGDKSGAVTDVATAVAGPKVAEGVAGGVTKAVSKVAPQVAERLYTSALKPSTTIPAAERSAIAQTGMDAGIPVSATGADKLSGLIQNLNDKIAAQIKAGAQSGQTVDPAAVANRLNQTRAKFATQVNPESDLKAIDAAGEEFLRRQGQAPAGTAGPSNQIPVDQAQAIKQGTYQQLKARAYGELGSATVEAQKSLARGLKEELQTQFPEIKNLNAQESQFINLDGVLEKALNRIGNHQIMGIGTPIVAGAVGGAAGGTAGVVAGLLKAVIDDPIAKSRLAIALSKAGKISPSAAIGRITQYSNALAQSQNGQQQ
jgi:hypothetical protein